MSNNGFSERDLIGLIWILGASIIYIEGCRTTRLLAMRLHDPEIIRIIGHIKLGEIIKPLITIVRSREMITPDPIYSGWTTIVHVEGIHQLR